MSKTTTTKPAAKPASKKKATCCYECKVASATISHPLVSGAHVCEGCADALVQK
jgi:hypothetical protein